MLDAYLSILTDKKSDRDETKRLQFQASPNFTLVNMEKAPCNSNVSHITEKMMWK